MKTLLKLTIAVSVIVAGVTGFCLVAVHAQPTPAPWTTVADLPPGALDGRIWFRIKAWPEWKKPDGSPTAGAVQWNNEFANWGRIREVSADRRAVLFTNSGAWFQIDRLAGYDDAGHGAWEWTADLSAKVVVVRDCVKGAK